MIRAVPTHSTTATAVDVALNPIATLRQRLADAVEVMIAYLDALDGDPDLEDAGDAEPSLGALDGAQHRIVLEREGDHASRAVRFGITDPLDQSRWAGAPTSHVDLEEQCEDEGAQCDDEGHDSDREEDRSDYEPWLGRSETGLGACQGSGDDYSTVLDGEVLRSPVDAL